MKLDKKGKEDLRKIIEERLQDVPQGQRIHIDKKILEELLFDILSFNLGNKLYKMKKPVWSGDFLSKIDLSEISFEDVSWKNPYEYNDGFDMMFYHEIEENLGGREQYLKYCKFLDLLDSKYEGEGFTPIKYINTNAEIDFKESWEYKIAKVIYISGCDFSGTNLSKNDMSPRVSIWHSNLSNTGIIIVPGRERCYISNTNLEGIDLSAFRMNPEDMYNSGFSSCILRNTGFKIIDFSKENIEETDDPEEIIKHLKNGDYDGCYINGKLMKSKEERQETARQMRMQYQQFRDELVRSTLSDIDEQIKGMKK